MISRYRNTTMDLSSQDSLVTLIVTCQMEVNHLMFLP